ncbi:MAG: ABC transporter substrate-binding protein [Dehalococcoidales bacterium]|nr:ABC transporter substrate-binding protein [Dehalococcoidales bacterium]
MKKLLTFMLVLSLVIGIIGCKSGTTKETTTTTGAVYATGFTIEILANGVKKVTDGENQTLLLVPKGKKPPAGYENLPQVTVPVKSAVILSVTFGALMRPLEVLDSVVGSGTLADQLYIEEMKQGYDSGRIKYVGGGTMGAPDFEAIQLLKPDIVFCSTGYPDMLEYYNKLKSMGLNVAVCNDYLEADPLARLEWIKFIAAFYGKDAVATTYFEGVEKRIEDIKIQAALSSRLAIVLWASIFMGNCYVSGGESYVAKMIDMAGGEYIFKDLAGSGASSISLEELYARGKNCNVFIYASTPPYINSIKEIVDNGPVLADLPIVKSGTIYCFQPWFYQISDKPDEIVQDLAYIFHPSRFPGYKLKHFMLLPKQ